MVTFEGRFWENAFFERLFDSKKYRLFLMDTLKLDTFCLKKL